MNEGGLDAGTVLGDGAGQLDEGREAATSSPHQPVVEEAQGAPWLSKMEDLTELLLEEVSAVERLVGLLDSGELGLLARGQILGVLPEREAGVLEFARERGQAFPTRLVPD